MKFLLAMLCSATAICPPDAAQGAPKAETPAEIKLPALLVGDPAPALAIEHWGNGIPIEAFKEGQVYIITICGKDLPVYANTLYWLRTALHQHPDPKLLLVTTTTADNKEEAKRSEEHLHTFEPLVTPTQTYGFAGELERAMGTTWCKAAEREFAPVTFVVDGHGRIAWIGDRTELRYLEPTLTEVLADTHNIEKLAKDYRAYIPTYRKAVALKSKVGAVRLESPIKKNFDAVKELLELDPDRSGHFAGALVLGMRDKLGKPDEARAWARTYFEGAGKNNTEAMHAIAGLVDFVAEADPKDLELAITVMKRAVLLSKEKHVNYLYWLGVLHAKAGDLEAAIAVTKKAAAIEPDMERLVEEYEKQLRERTK